MELLFRYLVRNFQVSDDADALSNYDDSSPLGRLLLSNSKKAKRLAYSCLLFESLNVEYDYDSSCLLGSELRLHDCASGDFELH